MAASHHVLLIGGHGRIAQHLTPLLLKRSWTVTSIIRTEEQVSTIEKLGESLPGKLNVLVRSVEEVGSQADAQKILDEVKPDYVAWSAGAGGRGGPERTNKIDRDAAIAFINAAAATPTIKRFLMVSYLGARRRGASWWPEGQWDRYHKTVNNAGTFNTYHKAKLAADEVLYEASKNSSHLIGISLRPGALSFDPASTISLGKTRLFPSKDDKEDISREAVAQAADALLAADGVKNTWLDMLSGEEEVQAAVDRVVRDGVDAAEGEDIYAGN